MKSTKYKFWAFLLLALTAAAFLMFACGEDEPTEPEPPEALEIPPLSTFLMDFDDFITSGLVHVSPEYSVVIVPDSIGFLKTTLSHDNWGWAALHVGVWNTIITVGLAVPVAAFVESFNHEPEQQADGSWMWSYDFTVAADEYTAELHGEIDNLGTEWEMYISKYEDTITVFEDFLWYSGQADLFVTEGTWTLNKHPEDPIPYVYIEWHRSLNSETADIKYTNIVPDGPENGGYIFYGITTDTTYDAFYDIYNKGYENLTEIEWNRTTKDGQVKDPHHFEDEEWHCWNGDHEDIDCP